MIIIRLYNKIFNLNKFRLKTKIKIIVYKIYKKIIVYKVLRRINKMFKRINKMFKRINKMFKRIFKLLKVKLNRNLKEKIY